MNLPGPSSLGRIAACPTSETLPHVRSSSEYARRGDIIHAFLASCAMVGRDVALLQADAEHYDTLAAIPLDRLPPLDPRRHMSPGGLLRPECLRWARAARLDAG